MTVFNYAKNDIREQQRAAGFVLQLPAEFRMFLIPHRYRKTTKPITVPWQALKGGEMLRSSSDIVTKRVTKMYNS